MYNKKEGIMTTDITTKTAEQRQQDIKTILQDIDNNVISRHIPADITAIITAMAGMPVRDLIPPTQTISPTTTREIETKRGAKLYEVYTTGYGLLPVKRAGAHTIEIKLSVMIR